MPVSKSLIILFYFAFGIIVYAWNPGDLRNGRTIFIPVAIFTGDSNGHPVSGMEAKDFELFQGSRRLVVDAVVSNNGPAGIGIVFDLSGSMHDRDRRRSVVRRLAGVIENSHPENEYFVTVFDGNRISDSGILREKTRILEHLDQLIESQAKGSSPLYDAIQASLMKAREFKALRRFLVLITDGIDSKSKTVSLNELEQNIRGGNIVIFSISMDRESELKYSILQGIPSPQGTLILDRIASLSGGRSLVVSERTGSANVIDGLLRDFESRYLIRVQIDNSVAKPKRRVLRTRVSPMIEERLGKLTVKARNEFYF